MTFTESSRVRSPASPMLAKAGGFRGLQENQRVEFTSGQGVKGPQAEEVHMI